jgi:hypothetical protein
MQRRLVRLVSKLHSLLEICCTIASRSFESLFAHASALRVVVASDARSAGIKEMATSTANDLRLVFDSPTKFDSLKAVSLPIAVLLADEVRLADHKGRRRRRNIAQNKGVTSIAFERGRFGALSDGDVRPEMLPHRDELILQVAFHEPLQIAMAGQVQLNEGRKQA